MDELTALPNIGKELANKLVQVEIDSPGKLRSEGSEQAFLKIKTIDETACINMLYALEGAVQGIRWHGLDKARKQELLEFFKRIG